ncbi:MAG: hypothetical protein QM500_02370 [Methylococcales bacterium]
MSLFSEIFNISNPLMIAVGTAVIATYAVAVSKMLNRITERKETEEKRFLKALSAGIKSGVITEFSDIENIYKGVIASIGDEEVNRARLAKWLRAYLLQIFENEIDEKNRDLIKSIKKEITEYINQVEKASPHVGLPDLERSIVRDIEAYLNSDQKDGVSRKLDELVAAIQVREDSFKKMESTNKWAVPLSVVGLILTLIFGISSIFSGGS